MDFSLWDILRNLLVGLARVKRGAQVNFHC